MTYCNECSNYMYDYTYCSACNIVICFYCASICYLCIGTLEYCDTCVIHYHVFPYDDEICICKLCNYAVGKLTYLHKIGKCHFKLKRVKILTYEYKPALLKIAFIL